jgi:glycosyltransferase involved in cell wall biosynthesis
MSQKLKIIFLGSMSFPYGMAEIEKQTLIARALCEVGCDVKFICTTSHHYDLKIPFKGQFKGINYLYANLSAHRFKNKYINYINVLLGRFIEILILLLTEYDFAIVNSRSYNQINKYSKILHLRNKKLFLTHTEDLRSMYPNANKKKLSKIDDFENKTWTKIDGVFPISEELIKQVKNKNPLLPQLKIPVLTDLMDAEDVIMPDDIVLYDYFMFCGSADYFETINFIISGFEIAKTNSKLLLVVNSNNESLQRVRNRIDITNSKDRIFVKSSLDKRELWGYYKFAKALLIPLNFDQRDKARFPHKIGEYCASKIPIISSDWGEVGQYFKNMENSLLLKSNNPIELGDAIVFLQKNPEILYEIAQNSYNLALKEFNYKSYGEKILSFIRN